MLINCMRRGEVPLLIRDLEIRGAVSSSTALKKGLAGTPSELPLTGCRTQVTDS